MTRETGTVVSLCDRSGIMVAPWVNAGYAAVTVDKEPAAHNLCEHIKCDLIELVRYNRWDIDPLIIFAFPPCTDLAISGARWFRDKGLQALIDALELVETCRKLTESSYAPWMLENPVGVLSTYWRDPDFAFDPCDYGDPYTKRTWIWCGNGFVMPPKIQQGDMFDPPTVVEPTLGSIISNLPDSNGRREKREATPHGFADAVFRANRIK